MNFVRQREIKGRKDAWKKRMAMRREWMKKKTKRRKKNIFCSCSQDNRSDFEIPRDSANCDLQCGKRKLLPVMFSSGITIQITIHVTNVKCRNKYDFLIQQFFQPENRKLEHYFTRFWTEKYRAIPSKKKKLTISKQVFDIPLEIKKKRWHGKEEERNIVKFQRNFDYEPSFDQFFNRNSWESWTM